MKPLAAIVLVSWLVAFWTLAATGGKSSGALPTLTAFAGSLGLAVWVLAS
jgi:hypothetical protein